MRDCCRMAKTEVKPNMKQAVPCVASPCKRIITTKTMTSEPRLSQSEREFRDSSSCGLLEKENVLLFSMFLCFFVLR